MLEIVIVLAVFSILVTSVLVGLREQMHLTTLQQYLQQLDMQGSRLMQELTIRLRPAILPVATPPDNDSPANSARKTAFLRLDDPNNGFRVSNGMGDEWKTALEGGVESIAFVVPVAADGGSDVFDNEGHMTVGQRRSTGVSLDCLFTPEGPDDFVHTNTNPTCSLVRVDPDILNNDAIGGAADISAWPNALYTGLAPATSAFSVIRYVPVREGGTLRRIAESDEGVDLNGDGDSNDTFNIGKLQLVNVGGTHAVRPLGGSPALEMIHNVPPEIIDLSADFILREVNPVTPKPIFRYQYEDGTSSLVVRVNLFDPNGNQILRTRAPHQQGNFLNREFETKLALRNMER